MDESNSPLSCLIRVRISSAMLCPRGGMDDHTGFRFRRCRFESCRGCLKGLGVVGNIMVSKTVVAYSNRAAPVQTRECIYPFIPPWRHRAFTRYTVNVLEIFSCIEYIFRSINRTNHLPPKQALRIRGPPGILFPGRSTAVSAPGWYPGNRRFDSSRQDLYVPFHPVVDMVCKAIRGGSTPPRDFPFP